MYSTVVCTTISTDCTENTIPLLLLLPLLLFTGLCQVMAGCCGSTILASNKYATLFPLRGCSSRVAYRCTVISSFLRTVLAMSVIGLGFLPCGTVFTVITPKLLLLLPP
jgi:hypothetical protein